MTFDYLVHYDSNHLRGTDDPATPRPWNLHQEILNYAGKDKNLLDIGCGTAFKLIPLAPYFQEIIGLDPSQSMLEAANKIVRDNNLSNIKITEGEGEALPYATHSFDIITCMLSRWSVSEIHRVLKPNGVVIVEHIHCEDKKDFKLLFGKDEEGWRGQFLNFSKDNYIAHYKDLFSEFFKMVSIQEGHWDTIYTPQGLSELLHYTPTIRHYDEQRDASSLKKAMQLFETSQGIKLTQSRLLIKATNHELV
jgi:SAM-dependent methyltransferase